MTRRNLAVITALAGVFTALLTAIGIRQRRRNRIFRPLENDPVLIVSADHRSHVVLDVKCQVAPDYEFNPTEDQENKIAEVARHIIEVLKHDIADSFEVEGKLKPHVTERANGELRRRLVDLDPDRKLIFTAEIRQVKPKLEDAA